MPSLDDGWATPPAFERLVELPAHIFDERAASVTPVLLQPKAATLPLEQVPPDVFETLLTRIGHEVLGLRNITRYGVRGQRQQGIDIVGSAPDGTRTCIQCKRYRTFTAPDFTAAVDVYDRGELPFAVERLIVAVPVLTEPTDLVNERIRLDAAHDELEISLWGRTEIADALQPRPDIVSEFFGDTAAALFCSPSPALASSTPPPDRIGLASAVLRGPIAATGAEHHLQRAEETEQDDPAAAASAIAAAQQTLEAGGFLGHADVLTERRAALLIASGDTAEAAQLLSDRIWRSLALAELDLLQPSLDQLQRIAGSHPTERRSGQLARIAATAMHVEQDPIGDVPSDVDDLLELDDDLKIEQARLALLLATHSATTPGSTWRRDHIQTLSALATHLPTSDPEHLRLRLEVEIAESTGDWTAVTSRARRRRLPASQGAWVTARYAAALSSGNDFEAADEAWEDAIREAVLAGDTEQAADWVYSRRVLTLNLNPDLTHVNDFHRLAQSLRATGSHARASTRLQERGVIALLSGQLRQALLLLRRQIRAAHDAGDWGQELEARRYLAQGYEQSGELLAAAYQRVLGSDVKGAGALSERAGDVFLDVAELTQQQPYWIAAAAFRLLGNQGDLVPNDVLPTLLDRALQILDDADAGVLVDSPNIGPHLAHEAWQFLAATAERTDVQQAGRLLALYAPRIDREAGHYRPSDDAHVDTCSAIARTHPTLRAQAVDQLLRLLEHGDFVASRVEQRAGSTLAELGALDQLQSLATSGNSAASRLVATYRDELPQDLQQQAMDAAAGLTAPLTNRSGAWSIGTNAVQQSLLARHLEPDTRRELIAEQLRRVAAPNEPSVNRSDYLLAASNLTDGLDDPALFEAALELTRTGSLSRADLERGLTSHPLSAVRFAFDADVRPDAYLLAASLAVHDEQREQVLALAISTARLGGNADYRVARALQRFSAEELIPYVALLGTQPSRNLRANAALTWASTGPGDSTLGVALAQDIDSVVRRTLAGALRRSDSGELSIVEEVLSHDPRWSIRHATPAPSGEP